MFACPVCSRRKLLTELAAVILLLCCTGMMEWKSAVAYHCRRLQLRNLLTSVKLTQPRKSGKSFTKFFECFVPSLNQKAAFHSVPVQKCRRSRERLFLFCFLHLGMFTDHQQNREDSQFSCVSYLFMAERLLLCYCALCSLF